MKVPLFAPRYYASPFFSSALKLHAEKQAAILPGRVRPEDSQMAAPLVVSIPHSLGREEAMRRLKTGLSRAASSVPVLSVDEERWEGSRMIFRVRAIGQAAAGHVDVAEDHVRVEVLLPWLLQRFAEVAQAAIRSRGNLLLTRKS
jgi:hypothetical protein